MIPVKELSKLIPAERDALFKRFGADFSRVMIETVAPIINDIKKRGDEAVKFYTQKFDGCTPDPLLASQDEIDAGFSRTSKDVLAAFEQAKENITEFHTRQRRDNIEYSRGSDITLGVMYQPIDSAAMYVPGGKASYPSSVLMGVVPARIAGVPEITVITPPDKNGSVPDAICAVCKICGVKHILKAGGAQGIAAAGLGTQTVPKSNIIVGPGNIFVTAAKTYLFSQGIIGIDSMAGPSEVLIIADETANAKWVAFDLLSQAEHEERAMAILVTTSRTLAENVQHEIERDLAAGGGRAAIKQTAIADHGLILIAESLDQAIEFSNSFGPEHMEFAVQNPMTYLSRIRNVGSLFLGQYAPVAVGDYFSGTNHILPTGGAARFSSGVSVDTFMRRTTYQFLTRDGLAAARQAVDVMATSEGFADKHAGSIHVRF